jgi:hypothetical protein
MMRPTTHTNPVGRRRAHCDMKKRAADAYNKMHLYLVHRGARGADFELATLFRGDYFAGFIWR